MRFSALRSVGFGLALGLSSVADAATVSSTILIFARDAASSISGYSGLQGYGIPYQVVLVPSTGITLPQLNSSTTVGNYGGIVVLGEVSYDMNGSFSSALTAAQWQQLFDYQVAFGVRMVRLDVYPGPDFGATALGSTSADQPVSISNSTGFPTAQLKSGAGMSTAGLYHYPASITNSSIAWEVASFAAGGGFDKSTAAVINRIGARQQMAWFLPWATDWSATSNFLQHAWINWMTRGVYSGIRRTYFSTQIDDVFLETEMYRPVGAVYRLTPTDLQAHKDWQADIRSRMNPSSNYTVELGYNGNGDIEAGVAAEENLNSGQKCVPTTAIEYDDYVEAPYDWMKPLGSGTNIWPSTPATYGWSVACTQVDGLMQWLNVAANRNSYMHVSHTFSHMNFNNATYSDVNKEITFNQKWLAQVGFTTATWFSPNGLIPPAITGLNNGDAIRALLTNGIKYVVGDNTRPVLRNSNTFWPLTTTAAVNGYAGLTIVPRWATNIYYNCDTANCTTQEWIDTSAGQGGWAELLVDAKNTNTRNLLGLHWDPFMFHQANLKSDAESFTLNGVAKQMSIFQIWVETVVAEMTRLTTWPLLSLKHDHLALMFINRQTRDQCAPLLSYTTSADGKQITAVTLTTNGNRCGTTVPITVPGNVASTKGYVTQKIGSDSLTIWVPMTGTAQTFTLSPAVNIS